MGIRPSMAQNMVQIEYFLNSDPGYGNAIQLSYTPAPDIQNLNFYFEISELNKGFNHLYVRSKDENGLWSLTNVKSFYKEIAYTTQQNIVNAEYFINTDPGFGNGVNIPLIASPNLTDLSFVVDISQLPLGFNHLYVRSKDENGLWSLTNVKSFYKETVYATSQNVVKAEYFINTDPGFGNGVNIPLTASPCLTDLSFVVDISDLPLGFNHLYVRSKDENGLWSLTNVKSFYKEIAYTTPQNIIEAEYFINADPGFGNGINIPLTASPNLTNISFVVDISQLPLGFNHLYVRSKDENGIWSLTNVKSFYKEKIYTAPQNIVKAEYYLNTDPGIGNGIEITLIPSPNISNFSFIADVSVIPVGVHKLYLRAIDENGKWSLTNIYTFDVECADVTVDFEPSPGCATMPLEITDLSTNVYPLAQYKWDFGDGTPVVVAGKGNISHTFSAVGEYDIKLVIDSRTECVDSITKTILINEPPTVYAGENQTVCAGSELVLDATYTFGSLSWNYGVVNGEPFTATVTRTYTATVESEFGCGPVTDQVTVTVIQHPIAAAGEDVTICEDMTYPLDESVAQNYSSLLWSGNVSEPTILHPFYTPTSSDIENGFAELCLTAHAINPCTISANDCLVITIQKNPVVSSGDDVTICENENYLLSESIAQNYSSLLWTGNVNDPAILHPVYTPTSSDIENGFAELCLTAQAINPCIISASDCLMITIQKNPVINAGENATICDNESIETSSAFASNFSSLLWYTTNGQGSFQNGDQLLATYTPHPGDPESVELCLEASPVNPCSNSTFDCFNLTIIPSPQVQIVNPPDGTEICKSTLIGLQVESENCSSFNWTTTGNGLFTNPTQGNIFYTPGTDDLLAGEVTLCVEGMPLTGCYVSATNCITLIVQPDPQILIEPEVILGCSNYDFMLDEWLPYQTNATIQYASSVEWFSNGDGTFSDPLSANPSYSIGMNDFINGSVTLMVTASGPGECNISASESTVLSIPTQLILISGFGGRGISSYINQSMLSVPEVLAPLGNKLLFIKNEFGQTYNPATGVNQLGNWDATGYLANFSNPPACLPIYGEHLTDQSFEVNGPTAYIPVLTDYPVAISDLFAGHLEKIEMIFDWSTYQSWTPDNPELLALTPGFAYSLSTVNDAEHFTVEFPPFSWEEPLINISITGIITDSMNGNPVPGVEVLCTGQSSSMTQIDGSFMVSVPKGWSGSITPVKENWEFTPVSKVYSNLVVNIYDQNFSGVNTECDPGWEFVETFYNHVISIPTTVNPTVFGVPLALDDWIGVFYVDDEGQNACGGTIQWNGTTTVQMIAHGDDPLTPEKDGFTEGETIKWKMFSCNELIDCDASVTYHPSFPNSTGTFEIFGFSSLVNLTCQLCQEITLNENWNDVSLFIQPLDSQVSTIMQPAVNDLIIMNNLTSMYWPQNSINTIGNWDIQSGYVVKMDDAAGITLLGSPLSSTQVSLSLVNGSWFYLPVLASCGVSVDENLSPFQNEIVIVKEIIGNKVWWPEMNISTLTELIPGRSYAIKIADDVLLEFPVCSKSQVKSVTQVHNQITSHWGNLKMTPNTHIIFLPKEMVTQFLPGDEIGIFNTEGYICGAYTVTDINRSDVIVANGDDITTAEVEGMNDGEPFVFKVFNHETATERVFQVEFDEQMPNQGYFATLGLSAINSINMACNDEIGDNFNIAIIPNPSNGIFKIVTGRSDQSFVWQILNIHSSIIKQGSAVDDFNINLSSYPKGVYYLKINEHNLVKKLVLN